MATKQSDRSLRRGGGRSRPPVNYRVRGSSFKLMEELPFILLVVLAAVTFALGGGSRMDIQSVGPLRAVAAIILAAAIFFQNPVTWRRVRVPVLALLVLGLIMAMQLVPLPQEWWSSLPQREGIVRLQEMAGMGEVSRPISISPMSTANSLASLVVPLAALLLAGLIDEKRFRRLPWIIVIAGVASALIGIAQVALPGGSSLYFYEITNSDSAVGLFSNRNHNAIFLTIGLIFCVVLMEEVDVRKLTPQGIFVVISALFMFAGLLVNASRTGLMGMGLVAAVFVFRSIQHWRASGGDKRAPMGRIVSGGLVAVLALSFFAAGSMMDRLPALQRLNQHSVADDQRVATLPTVLDMASENVMVGVGYGAFEQAYRIVEPESLLGPRYFNNAHDDWLQWVVEGGLPAIVLMLAVLVMLLTFTIRLIREGKADEPMHKFAWLGIFALATFAIGSVVDYPLRTPSLMLVAALAVVMLIRPFPPRVR